MRSEQQVKLQNSHVWRLIFIVSTFIYTLGYAQSPKLTWIGTLGGSNSEANAVSANGSVVVGVSANTDGFDHAFIWTVSNGMQDLGTLGGEWSEATGVSADGSVIVGSAYDSMGVTRAFVWTAANAMQDLGFGDFSSATAVSADGSVITFNMYPNGYRWSSSGGTEPLGTLGGDYYAVSDISADGLVCTGFSYNINGDPYAVRWTTDSEVEQIGTYYSFASGISGDGSTVTGFETGSAGLYRAFRWVMGQGFQFNIAGDFSEGNAVNFDGTVVVGNNSNGAFRLSDTRGLEDLNQIFSEVISNGSSLWDATDISADGKFIVGNGFNSTTGYNEGFLIDTSGVTLVENIEVLPNNFILEQNYPNPFNPTTNIRFQIPNSLLVNLKVYDAIGKEVATLLNEEKQPGNYKIEFDASALASGIYYYQLKAGDFLEIKKMLLLR